MNGPISRISPRTEGGEVAIFNNEGLECSTNNQQLLNYSSVQGITWPIGVDSVGVSSVPCAQVGIRLTNHEASCILGWWTTQTSLAYNKEATPHILKVWLREYLVELLLSLSSLRRCRSSIQRIDSNNGFIIPSNLAKRASRRHLACNPATARRGLCI